MPTYVVTDPNTGRKVRLTGDTPPTDEDLDEIFASIQNSEQTPVQQQDRGIIGGIVDAGLEAMAGINRGATGLVDFAASMPNAALQLAGSDARIPSLTNAFAPATAGNFMQPGLARDVVRQGSELAAPGVATGSVMRQAAAQIPAMANPTVTQGVIRQLGSSTAGQDAAYSALSGSGQAVGQNIGGETGAMIGGIAAPIAPAAASEGLKMALRGIFGPINRTESARILDDFASFGETPSVGMMSGREGVQAAENVSSRAIGGAPLKRKSDAIAERIQSRLASISDNISPREGAEEAGVTVQRGLTGRGGFVDRFRQTSTRLWGRADSLIDQDAPVSLTNTRAALDRLVRGGEVGGILDNPRLVQLRDVLENTADIDYRTLRDIRSSIGQRIASNDIMSDIPRAELRQIYGALSDDVRELAAASGSEALEAFNRANTYSRSGHQRIESVIQPIANKANPDEVFRAIARGGEGIQRINSIKRSLTPSEWEVVASNVVRRLGRSSSGQQNAVGDGATGDSFSLQKFVTDWDKLGRARAAIFSGSERLDQYSDDLNRIARAASVVKEASRPAANASGTAQAASRIAAGTGFATGTITGSPTLLAATMGSIAMNNAGARLMTNERFVRWLARNAEISPDKASSAIAQLVNIAEQSSLDDAAIIQQLTEELEQQQWD